MYLFLSRLSHDNQDLQILETAGLNRLLIEELDLPPLLTGVCSAAHIFHCGHVHENKLAEGKRSPEQC